ncbi:SGNH/GDSL hydrolase family protein [Marinobacter daepoensis]|uniref:SGNH/GDSL hydrolase family protein n=1 Tax=Marinobacter daepoensis TaxID=262077 RepID=UPI0003F7233C|nr:SGNH/GDSL hydrolase family protein [Marinobacter daepoensis]MBY6033273.1 SGNH/GDSL hydrolase family protein [Marinobacter daepoensis]
MTTNERRSFLPSFSLKALKPAVALGAALLFTGCSELGYLLSNDTVTDADNNQVVFVGDSIFALSGEIQNQLEARAGETFRRYTVSGAELSGELVAPSIPNQFRQAVADNPDIETIVGDAGGNDILIPAIAFNSNNCKTPWWRFGRLSQQCRDFIDDIYVEGVDFLNEMAGAGVQQGILTGYYYTKNGLFLLDDMKEAIDYGNATLARVCENSVLNCTFIDPRGVINDSDIIFDGIHPTDSGSKKIADLIWPRLQPLL